ATARSKGADVKGTVRAIGILVLFRRGEVAEWSIAAVSKTVEPLRVPEVRILSSPPSLYEFTGRRGPASPTVRQKIRQPPPCRDGGRRGAWWCRLPRSPVASESAARYSDRRTRERWRRCSARHIYSDSTDLGRSSAGRVWRRR